MEALKLELEKLGHEVQIPFLSKEEVKYGSGNKINFEQYIAEHGGIENFPAEDEIWTVKENAILDHFEKLEWADRVFIANYEKRGIEGYIGGNTLIEMGVAFYLKKKICVLNQVSSKLQYRPEIYAMKPEFLNGDLKLLK